MDSRLADYLADATFDDGSCPPALEGCTNPAAANHRAVANIEDGSCGFAGCMDSTMSNHNPSATIGAVCVPHIVGCTDSNAPNYHKLATVDDGTCTIVGCTDPTSSNYRPDAAVDDGTCDPVFPGCTDSVATNFKSAYTVCVRSLLLPPSCPLWLVDFSLTSDSTCALPYDPRVGQRQLVLVCRVSGSERRQLRLASHLPAARCLLQQFTPSRLRFSSFDHAVWSSRGASRAPAVSECRLPVHWHPSRPSLPSKRQVECNTHHRRCRQHATI